MSNFSFLYQFQGLSSVNKTLVQIAETAENLYVDKYYINCLMTLRAFSEHMANSIALYLSIKFNRETKFAELIRKIRLKMNQKAYQGQLREIVGILDGLRVDGNVASHQQQGDQAKAARNLEKAFDASVLYAKLQSSVLKVDLPEIPQFYLPTKYIDVEYDSSEYEQEAKLSILQEKIQEVTEKAEQREVELQKIIKTLQERLIISSLESRQQYDEQLKKSEVELMNLLQEKERELSRLIQELEQIKRDNPQASENFDELEDKIVSQSPTATELEDGVRDFDRSGKDNATLADILSETETVLRKFAILVGKKEDQSYVLTSGTQIKPGLGLTTIEKQLIQRAIDVNEGVFNLIIVGEFNHGKSTLINALMGKDFLPTAVVPTTAIITVLVHGEREYVELHRESAVEEISLADFKKLKLKYGDDVSKFQEINFAKVYCQHRLCHNGVRIIDSPGLADQVAMTRTTLSYLPNSHASILVLSALQPLNQNERDFIDQQYRSQKNALPFFIVNRIDQLNSEEECQEVKQRFYEILKDLFVDEMGVVDEEFMSKRLLYTNAFQGFNASQSDVFNTQVYQESGVERLESELFEYLTGSGKLQDALFASTRLMVDSIYEAERRIFENTSALQLPIEEFLKRKAVIEVQLNKLEDKKYQISNMITIYSQLILDKAYRSFEEYLKSMEASFESDFNLNIKLFDALGAMLDFHAKKELQREIKSEIEKYLQNKFSQWTIQLQFILENDETVQRFYFDLRLLISEFEEVLSTIHDQLSSINIADSASINDAEIIENLTGNRLARIFLLATSVGIGDYGVIANLVGGPINFGQILTSFLFEFTAGTALFALFGGPITLAIMSALNIGQFIINFIIIDEKIKKNIKHHIFTYLRDPKNDIEGQLKNAIYNNLFAKISDNASRILSDQINDERNRLADIESQLNLGTDYLEKETERMNLIKSELLLLFNYIALKVYGREYSLENIIKVAESQEQLG